MLSPDRSSRNGLLYQAPPIIKPYAIADGGAFAISNFLLEQNERYLSTLTLPDKDEVEQESTSFFEKYMHDMTFKQLVDETKGTSSFQDAWQPFYKLFPKLVQFAGGLATIFPGTSAVESDFSIIGWEKDKYHMQLSNLSLEGILHAKQFDEIREVQEYLSELLI